MALKIRLRQQGRTNHHTYRLVVTDTRNCRDGKYVEALGWYNPRSRQEDQIFSLKPDRLQHWISQGAEVTEKAETLIAAGAPEVLRQHKAHVAQQRTKACAKRRERRRAKKAAAK